MSGLNLERICNRTSFKALEVGQLREGQARRVRRWSGYDVNVTLRQAVWPTNGRGPRRLQQCHRTRPRCDM